MTQTGEGYTPMVQQYMEIKKQHEDKLLSIVSVTL